MWTTCSKLPEVEGAGQRSANCSTLTTSSSLMEPLPLKCRRALLPPPPLPLASAVFLHWRRTRGSDAEVGIEAGAEAEAGAWELTHVFKISRRVLSHASAQPSTCNVCMSGARGPATAGRFSDEQTLLRVTGNEVSEDELFPRIGNSGLDDSKSVWQLINSPYSTIQKPNIRINVMLGGKIVLKVELLKTSVAPR